MSEANDRWMVRRASCHIDPEASVHDLLNDATEWLQYARGLMDVLSEFVHESDTVDCARIALSLEAIAAITHLGLQCSAQAHARIAWESAERANRTYRADH